MDKYNNEGGSEKGGHPNATPKSWALAYDFL